MEVSDRQRIPINRKEWKHQNPSEPVLFLGNGFINRPVSHLPSHPHPPSLKKVPTVPPQFSSVPVHLPPFQPSHSPTSLYIDCKGFEVDGPHKGNQTSQIPGRLAYQGPVSGGGTSEISERGRPNTVHRVDNPKREVRAQTHTGVFFCGL